MACSLLLRATAPARRLFQAARPMRGEEFAAARRRIVVAAPPPAASAPPSLRCWPSPRGTSTCRPAPGRIDRVKSSRLASFSTSTRASGGEVMAGDTEAPHVVEDCRGVLQVLSDGTTIRSAAAPYTVEDRDDGRVEWRDAVYHPAHGLGVRMYRPAHHMAARFGPVRIAGYALIIPAFTSEAPTQSELGSRGSAFLSRDVAERYNRLALPAGANKDYPLMNPLGPDSPGLGLVGGRVLVVVGGDDMLKDNQVRYVERMKAAGNDVELAVFDGKEHGFFSRDPWSETSGEVVRVVGRFMNTDAADLTGADGQD